MFSVFESRKRGQMDPGSIYHVNTLLEHMTPYYVMAEQQWLGVLPSMVSLEYLHCTNVLNPVDGIPVDYMYCVREGVVKRLMGLWFDSSCHNKPYYLGRYVAVIYKNLISQHPPTEPSRSPRSIQKHFEFRKHLNLKAGFSTILYPLYLVMSLLRIFSSICSTFMLNTYSTPGVNYSSRNWCCWTYDKRFRNIIAWNLWRTALCSRFTHVTTTICETVGTSADSFTLALESKNRALKQLFHGNNVVHQQLVQNVEYSQTIHLNASSPNWTWMYIYCWLYIQQYRLLSQDSVHCTQYLFFGCASIHTPTKEESNALGINDHVMSFKKLKMK